MPVFAMGKTQELLAQLHFLQKSAGCLRRRFISGGWGARSARSTTGSRAARGGNTEAQPARRHPAAGDGWAARARFQSEEGPHLPDFLGMMTENTLSNIFAQDFWRRPHGIFFVGYCDPSSPAGCSARRSRAIP